jgi:hypothetical protein
MALDRRLMPLGSGKVTVELGNQLVIHAFKSKKKKKKTKNPPQNDKKQTKYHTLINSFISQGKYKFLFFSETTTVTMIARKEETRASHTKFVN